MYEWEKKTIQIVLPLYFLASFFSWLLLKTLFMCELKRENYTPGTLYNCPSLFVHLIRSVALETLFMTLTVCWKTSWRVRGELVVGESLDSRSHMQFMHTQTTLSNLTACQKPEKNSQKKKAKKRIIKAFTVCNCTENCQFYLSLSPRCLVLLRQNENLWQQHNRIHSHIIIMQPYCPWASPDRGDLNVFYEVWREALQAAMKCNT